MKYFSLITFLVFTSLYACSTKQSSEGVSNESKVSSSDNTFPDGNIIEFQSAPDTLKGSLKAYAAGKVGDVNVLIEYHSPAVRGRIIWGGLVPYNQVWVTGAHMATSISFDAPLMFAGNEVEAGKYALFTIPSEDEWVFILNKNWKQHLADKYNEQEDALKLSVKQEMIENNQERLRYVITEDTLELIWERKKIIIPLQQK
ncbi:MAG TPA: DUF2911 domain-containing protein [Cyclobacteriaceae bacterium]|nr:DUF2911 domain-containing protein [Cyclobacteriaceae bacterium]